MITRSTPPESEGDLSAKVPTDDETQEEAFYEEQAPEEEKKQFINFYISNEWYAIDITKIKSTVRVPTLTYLPGAPPHIIGIMNLRGTIVSVTDLKKVFGLPDPALSKKVLGAGRIIVIEHGNVETGLLVDKVAGTIEVPVSKIDPPLATLDSKAAEYIEGESEIDGKLLGILKVDTLLQKKTDQKSS